MKRILSAISIFLAAALAFCAMPVSSFAQVGAGEDQVIFYNMAGELGGAWSSDCIFVRSGDSWGMIDTGHRFESSIEDESGMVFDLPVSGGLSSQYEYKNGRDAVLYMMESFGLKHLDFILVTHAHSDHNGGVPEIAQLQYTDGNGNSRYIVDENTVYFYKQYNHVNNLNDDLERVSPSSWHNQAFYYQALKAMQERSAALVELSKGGVYGTPCRKEAAFAADLKLINSMPRLSSAYQSSGSAKDYYDDVLSFKMGALEISLYNLLTHRSRNSENVNSVAAVITNGSQKVATMADLDFEDGAEQSVSAQIYKDFGTVDLLKAMHHGTHKWSNTLDTIDYLQPKAICVTRRNQGVYGSNVSGAFSLTIAHARERYGTKFYEVGCSGFGLVAQFGSKGLDYYSIQGVGADAMLEDTDCCLSRLYPYEGWNEYYTDFYGNYVYYYVKDSKIARGWVLTPSGYYYYMGKDGVMQSSRWLNYGGNWYYLTEEGSMAVGFLEYNGSVYYFDELGAMRTGWAEVSGDWYYFNADGVMQSKCWVKRSGNWYYLAEGGSMATGWLEQDGAWYYLGTTGAMAKGWQQVGTGWFYFSAGGVMQSDCWLKSGGNWYYLKQNGAAATGWKQVGSYWYYFSADGVMLTGWQQVGTSWYYLNSAGRMLTGQQNINGRTYYFSNSGVWQQ